MLVTSCETSNKEYFALFSFVAVLVFYQWLFMLGTILLRYMLRKLTPKIVKKRNCQKKKKTGLRLCPCVTPTAEARWRIHDKNKVMKCRF